MFSQSLRDVLNRLYMDITRENMQKLSTILRQEFSQSILAKVVSQDAQNSQANLIVVDGIRRPKDIEYLEKLPNFILVSIEAEQEKRPGCRLGNSAHVALRETRLEPDVVVS